jgi:signal transduction histidine kinase
MASVKEGAELSKSYLQFTKIYSPNFAKCDIRTVLREVAASAKALASELGCPELEVKFETPQELHERDLDRAQLKMAFFNLCKNATEALVSFKTIRPLLTINCAENSGVLEIRVSDNGPGMPKEIADNLFMAFKTKKEGGTGLGLTITKKIIDVHGGSIRCETGPSGTTFVVTI